MGREPTGFSKLALVNILLVNSSDLGGGAERIARACLDGYRTRGHGAWLAVGHQMSSDDGVYRIGARQASPVRHGTLGPDEGQKTPSQILANGARAPSSLARRAARKLASKLGHEDFSFPETRSLLESAPANIDIVHCHNLHGGYFDLRFLEKLSWQVPVVLTMHDAWLLSGHCAHSMGCGRWRTGCGDCPDLTIYPGIEADGTRFNWRRKAGIFRQSRLFVSCPCNWLADMVEESMMAPGLAMQRTIENGVDLRAFRGGTRAQARRQLGLPAERCIVLTSGRSFRNNPFKDFATLRSSLRELGERNLGVPVTSIVLGDDGETERWGDVELCFAPYSKERDLVSAYLRACDIYVHPAKAETYPLAVIEAAAASRPVIASRVGGIPEQLIHGLTGLLVAPQDSTALSEALRQLILDVDVRERMGIAGLDMANRRFDENIMVDDYLNWFGEILEHMCAPSQERGIYCSS